MKKPSRWLDQQVNDILNLYVLFITCQKLILESWIYQFFSQILDYNEEEAAEEAEHDKTPSLSFSATTDSSVRNFEPQLFSIIIFYLKYFILPIFFVF